MIPPWPANECSGIVVKIIALRIVSHVLSGKASIPQDNKHGKKEVQDEQQPMQETFPDQIHAIGHRIRVSRGQGEIGAYGGEH